MFLFSGLPIAYKDTDVVKEKVNNQINYTDLITVLYFIGFKK